MNVLNRPGVVAGLLVAGGLLLHPATSPSAWLPGRPTVLAALFLLLALALAARAGAAPRRLGAILTGAGAVVLLGAVAGDGIRGHHGVLDLLPGQSRTNFDERGPGGRSLGLRPLGFALALEEVRPDGGVVLNTSGGARAVLTGEAAVSLGAYRFSRLGEVPTGTASRLRISVSGGGSDVITEVAPGRATTVGDLTLTLEEYFPDFALDDQRQPFTRSREPRNPGALLEVESGGRRFRVFVLQAMPGVHRVEEIDRSFSLLGIEPEVSVELRVHREPLALGALLGGLLLLAGVVLGGREP